MSIVKIVKLKCSIMYLTLKYNTKKYKSTYKKLNKLLQIRVNVAASGINFGDLLMVLGKYQVKVPAPFTPGSEYSGMKTKVLRVYRFFLL